MVNEELNCDIAIIGAGPAGSLAAWQAAQDKSEISICVFEEHPQIGWPPHCSGLVSWEGFLNLGLKKSDLNNRLIQNTIRRAKFISPDNNCVEIDRGPDSMVVLDRPALDSFFANRAKNRGCELKLGHRVQKISRNGVTWDLQISHKKEKKKYNSTLVIIAEGVHAKLSSSMGLPVPDKKWLFPAIQHEYDRVEDIESDCVELFFGRRYAPGFFGWFIPLNETSARVGIAINRMFSGKAKMFMKTFLKKHPLIHNRIKNSQISATFGGYVSGTGPVKETYKTNIMVVGDAAGQSKATTGGGVNIGGYCGRLAGLIASRIITEKITTTQGCQEYQKEWKARFEPELSILKLLRRIMTPLTDDSWNEIVQIAQKTDLGERLKTTDIDLHGSSIIKYALTPQVFIKGISLVPHSVVSLLRGFTS
ncbi:MAG: NAD(P)/FAD-dependent oxidoreductase [Promethearchaeota archaeon]